MADLERKMLQNLLLPGTARYGMQTDAQKSLPVRKAEINEIITFSTIGAEQTERALILKAFGNFMREKESERDWNFFDRNYVRPLTQDALKVELSRYLLLNPNIATKYYDKEDGLLVCMYFKNPPGRILRKQWSFKFENSIDFRGYLIDKSKHFST